MNPEWWDKVSVIGEKVVSGKIKFLVYDDFIFLGELLNFFLDLSVLDNAFGIEAKRIEYSYFEFLFFIIGLVFNFFYIRIAYESGGFWLFINCNVKFKYNDRECEFGWFFK